MRRWNALSDLDYTDEPWAGPDLVEVTCLDCGVRYEERLDERPPYRCPACVEARDREARSAQRRERRTA